MSRSWSEHRCDDAVVAQAHMQITDAIRAAESEHIVLLLLTAYLESLSVLGDTPVSIPASISQLPLAGKSDVENRATLLRNFVHAGAASHDRAVRDETLDVLVAASEHLHLMEDPRGQREWSPSEPSSAPAAAMR
jgi:hypothetical protein